MPILKFEDKYRWLSNFWPALVLLDGEEFPSVEHAYQAAKTHNKYIREDIAAMPKAADAKRYGKQFKSVDDPDYDGFENLPLRSDWHDIKLFLMENLVRQKFGLENPMLRSMLITTGSEEIIEGNWWGDTFWGVCRGVGENHLGKIIMKIRKELYTDVVNQYES